MKTGQRRGQNQKRPAFEQHGEAADLAGFILGPVEPARLIVIDRGARDHQDRNDRQDAEGGGQPQHGGESEPPSEQARQSGANHVAGMVERLIMAVLPIETGLANDAERHAGHGRADRRASDRGGDLGQRHQPKVL